MLNLTDPTLAPLVARYRAWVEAGNEEPRKHNAVAVEINKALHAERDRKIEEYKALSWYEKRGREKPRSHVYGTVWVKELTTITYQGFLDWAIREGIEVPKE